MSSGKCLPLFRHQEEAADFIVKRGGSGAIWHEMGVGKTRTALEIFARLREKDPELRMLVIAPLSLLEAAWGEDVKKFSEFSFWNLRNGWGVEGRIKEDVFAINYEFLISKDKLSKLIQMVKRSRDIDGDGHDWLCVLDESSRCKNYAAKTTKILLKLAPLFKYRLVMSGTPAPNIELEYWPQIQFACPGALGTSLTVFRSHFFHFVNRYTKAEAPVGRFATRAQAVETYRKCDLAISDAKRAELMALIRPIAHTARKKDCFDLPEQTDEIRMVEMSPPQEAAYRHLKRHLVFEIQNQVIAAPVALTKLMKLRQIVGGFVYNDVGEGFEIGVHRGGVLEGDQGTERILIKDEFSNPKLDELFNVIDEAGDQPIMIWVQFHWEQVKICHELHKRFSKIPTKKIRCKTCGNDAFYSLDGDYYCDKKHYNVFNYETDGQIVTLSSLTKDKDESIRAFKDGRARFLVAHPASAAHGLTFTNCSLQIFYSLDFSWERYEQARARIHRAGQVNRCTYVYILCRNTIDEAILGALRRKGDAQRAVYEALKEKG